MKTKDNTVLITGGATGIGFALAEMFVKSGNKVIICGRREKKLEEASTKLPRLVTRVCDVTSQQGRESLYQWIEEHYPELNILINNAGVQRSINLKAGTQAFITGDSEIDTNLIAPIYLTMQFIPLLLNKDEAAIINVSSGLRSRPSARMPVYCATKAGLHSFTESLRNQLSDTNIKVFELVPPRVATSLGREDDAVSGGIPPSAVAEAALKALKEDEYEIIVE
ncbi:MAG: SDR family NAD(P)-dependent oxidoreductase [Dehalococcoidales bacterium]|nr:SDR family NAD(P)-dependent oxidoreductase [Dehalococcoidales bacterium]